MISDIKSLFKSLASTAIRATKNQTLNLLSAMSTVCGRNCLTRDDTISFCKSLGYSYMAGEPMTFSIGDKIRNLEVMRRGIVRINRSECLYTDFGNRAAAVDYARPKIHMDHVIALWSHPWLGYYHFLSEVTPKICRIIEESGKDLGGAKLCYPMIHRRYESELLRMLGISEDQVIDSKTVGGVYANKITVVPMAGWFRGHPNINLLGKHLMNGFDSSGPELLYLARSGRRRCLNDTPVIEHCQKLGFFIVTETPRSISDQIKLYCNAKIIVGPHGAAFTNMVWSPPGTRIVEMVPTTFDVQYYQKLSESSGNHYTKILCKNGRHARSGSSLDFRCDIPLVIDTIERELREIQNGENVIMEVE